MRANTQVVEPGAVTPMALPLSSATLPISGATLSVKWLPSVCVATIFSGMPASRNTRMSVDPAAPSSTSPAMTAFTRLGPPRNGTNSTFRFSRRKKPFSAATMKGPASA